MACLEYWEDEGGYPTHWSNILALRTKDPNGCHFSCLVESLEIWGTQFANYC